MKFISFVNCKGGVGKTALSYNIAGILAKQKKKVLIVDVDPQANASTRCGINNAQNEYECMVDVFEKGTFPSNIVIKSPIAQLPYLDLMPSSMVLTTTEMLLVTKTMRESILKNYFEKHKEFFSKYDYIIGDTAPNINLLNQNILSISDSIVLISDVSFDGINGCKLFLDAWTGYSEILKIQNNIKGIVINRFDNRNSLGKQLVDFIKKNRELQELSFDTIIPENVQVKKSENEGIPLVCFDTKCASFKALKELTKEFKLKGVI